jgi:molecular chaperone GrpE (heat shock protein)
MLSWLKQLFQPPSIAVASESTLALETELQSLRRELAEREKTIATLKQDLERQRQGEQSRLQAARQTEIETLLDQLSTPLSQLLTQTHLVEQQGKTVQPQDIFTVTNRLIRTLETKGLAISIPVGETMPFDPNRHQPLSSNQDIAAGTPVVVKMPGLAHHQKILKKALVELAAPGH